MQIRVEDVLHDAAHPHNRVEVGTRLADVPLKVLVAVASRHLLHLPDISRLPTVTHGNNHDNFY
jgi:hypothetical protein